MWPKVGTLNLSNFELLWEIMCTAVQQEATWCRIRRSSWSLIFAFSFCILSRSYFHLLADIGHSDNRVNYREMIVGCEECMMSSVMIRRRFGWAEHVTFMGRMRNSRNSWVGNPEWNRPLGGIIVDEIIKLRWILTTCEEVSVDCTVFIRLRTGERVSGTSDSIKGGVLLKKDSVPWK